MQKIVAGTQPGALKFGGPTRADTPQIPQLTCQWLDRRL